MLGKIVTISTVAAGILLLFLMNVSTPSRVGPLGILAAFVLFYIVVLGLVTLLLRYGSVVVSRASRLIMARRPLYPLDMTRSYYFASILALGPVMLVGMQSVGGVSITEVLLVIIFMTIGCVYVTKRTV